MTGWVGLAVWIFGVFASIVLHELGHVAAGLHYGWRYTGMIF